MLHIINLNKEIKYKNLKKNKAKYKFSHKILKK